MQKFLFFRVFQTYFSGLTGAVLKETRWHDTTEWLNDKCLHMLLQKYNSESFAKYFPYYVHKWNSHTLFRGDFSSSAWRIEVLYVS